MKSFLFKTVAISLIALLQTPLSRGANVVKTWDNLNNSGAVPGNNNFFNAQNWNGDTRPDYLPGGNTDRILFNGAGSGTTIPLNVNGTQTAYEIKSWEFTAGTYTFNNSQNLTLGDTTTLATNTGWLTNNGTGLLTFNNSSVIGFRFGGINAAAGPVTLGTNPTLNIGFGLSGASNNVTIQGDQPVTIGGILEGAGNDTSLGGVLVKQGTNTLFLNGASSLWNGRVEIGGGAIRINKAASLGSAEGRTTILGGASSGRLELTGGIAIGERFHLGGRTLGNQADHIRSVGGNNVLTAAVALDDGGTEYAIFSETGALAISGDIEYGSQTLASTLRLGGGGNGEISGRISPGGVALGIVKGGSGTWTLPAANGFTGPIEVTAGRLNLTTAHLGNGSASVADGATLGLKLAALGQSFSPSSFTLGAATGSTVSFELGSFGNPIAPVIQTGPLTVNGSNVINLSASGLSVGQFTLISYSSITGAGFPGLTLGSLPARTTASLVHDEENSRIRVNVTSFDYPRWTGATDAVWDVDDGTGTGTANWREFHGNLVTRYLQGSAGIDGVLFDDTASGPTTVQLSGVLTPAFVRVANDAQVYTFAGDGSLSGPTGIIKTGTSRLILAETGVSDFSATSQILGGTLEVGNGLTAAAGHLGIGPVVNSATLIFNRPDSYTFTGAISGEGNLIKRAPGVTTLSGTSTYTGVVTIEQGTL